MNLKEQFKSEIVRASLLVEVTGITHVILPTGKIVIENEGIYPDFIIKIEKVKGETIVTYPIDNEIGAVEVSDVLRGKQNRKSKLTDNTGESESE